MREETFVTKVGAGGARKKGNAIVKPEEIVFFVIYDGRHNKYTIERATYAEWLRRCHNLLASPCRISAGKGEGKYFVFDSIEKPPVVCTNKAKAQETLENLEIQFYESIRSNEPGKVFDYFLSFDDALGEVQDAENIQYLYMRFYNPINKMRERVVVPVVPGVSNFKMLEMKCLEILAKKKAKVAAMLSESAKKSEVRKVQAKGLHQQEKDKADELYGDDRESKIEAYERWRDIGFVFPAPSQIAMYKKESQLSWDDLVAYISNSGWTIKG